MFSSLSKFFYKPRLVDGWSVVGKAPISSEFLRYQADTQAQHFAQWMDRVFQAVLLAERGRKWPLTEPIQLVWRMNSGACLFATMHLSQDKMQRTYPLGILRWCRQPVMAEFPSMLFPLLLPYVQQMLDFNPLLVKEPSSLYPVLQKIFDQQSVIERAQGLDRVLQCMGQVKLSADFFDRNPALIEQILALDRCVDQFSLQTEAVKTGIELCLPEGDFSARVAFIGFWVQVIDSCLGKRDWQQIYNHGSRLLLSWQPLNAETCMRWICQKPVAAWCYLEVQEEQPINLQKRRALKAFRGTLFQFLNRVTEPYIRA